MGPNPCQNYLRSRGRGLGGSEKNISIFIFLAPAARAIIPDACPLGTFENQDGKAAGKTRYITGVASSDVTLACERCCVTYGCMGCRRLFLKEKQMLCF